VWPSRTRLIPAAANSIVAELKRGGATVASQTLARPVSGDTTTATFEHLKVGTLTLEAAAYPNANGSGTAQAFGASQVNVVAGQSSTVTLSMASTVHHLDLAPQNPTVGVGGTVQLSVTARDASGAVVLLWPGKLRWDTTGAAYASVDVNGLVTAAAPTGATPGSVTISVTDQESGKSTSVPVTVTSTTSVSVTPDPFTLSVGDTRTFAATVQNAPRTDVSWAVLEGPTGGSVSAAGLYTAPATAGAYHVVATSLWDNSKTGSATVIVQSGGAIVIIN
jgi:hypothetical protein